uniref:Interleukin-1 receptor-associated kinase 3 n=1 Tax=Echeneis naucrates TaxID=173247 RepID=A0A665W8C2_ECHNA
MDTSTLLYDVPPIVVDSLCRILDSGGDSLGWRALASRILPSQLEVRTLERLEAAGRSPSRELLWTWAQQNARVKDLLRVLQDMGHYRALQLFQNSAQGPFPMAKGKYKLQQPEVSFSSQTSSPMSTEENQSPFITFQNIKEGTRNFHEEMKISEGHFSHVYRAQIGNKTFAVKLFKQINNMSWKKLWDIFTKEMEVHHLYQHPNILDLLGCLSDEGHYCLLYPYLPHGSLSDKLHCQDGENPLSWQERLAIIKGVAKALHHLHTAQPCPVICGNISSDSILLDDAQQPKLSNFGLARLRPYSANPNCTITLNKSFYSNPGYLPEEYIRDGKLSFSLDVYSFGMVIMETVTGRRVIEDSPKQTLLRDLLVSEVEDSGGVDSCLQFLDKAAGQWPTALALSLLSLALDCTASRHRQRPIMEAVLQKLGQLLPPPPCPFADQPHSLDNGSPRNNLQSPVYSIPVEQDEQQSLCAPPAEEGPSECSQSEVTYLSEAAVDLYSSWPVQCSCAAETGSLACEDCRANGFTAYHTESPQGDFSVVENEAKQRLRTKLSLYDRRLVNTGELLSDMGLQ